MPVTEKQREASRKRLQERYEKGLCAYCDNPREGTHIRCTIHREITADYCAGRRDIWKVRGLCGSCGKNKPAEGRVSCQSCLDKSKELHRKAKVRSQ